MDSAAKTWEPLVLHNWFIAYKEGMQIFGDVTEFPRPYRLNDGDQENKLYRLEWLGRVKSAIKTFNWLSACPSEGPLALQVNPEGAALLYSCNLITSDNLRQAKCRRGKPKIIDLGVLRLGEVGYADWCTDLTDIRPIRLCIVPNLPDGAMFSLAPTSNP